MRVIKENFKFSFIFTIAMTFKFLIFSNLDLDLDHDFSVYVPALAVSGGAIPVKDVITLYGPLHASINALWLYFFNFGILSLRIFHIVLIILCLLLLREILIKFYDQKYVNITVVSLILLFPVEINASRVAGPYPLITIIILVFIYLINMKDKKYKYLFAGLVIGILIFLRPHVFFVSIFLFTFLIPIVYKERQKILEILFGTLISVLTGFFLLLRFGALRPWYEYNIVSTFNFFTGNSATQQVQDLGDRLGIEFNLVPIVIYLYFIGIFFVFLRFKYINFFNKSNFSFQIILSTIIFTQLLISYSIHKSIQYSSYALFSVLVIIIGLFAQKISKDMFIDKVNFEKQITLVVSFSLIIQIFPYYDPLHIYWSIILIFGFTLPSVLQNHKGHISWPIKIFIFIFIVINAVTISSNFYKQRSLVEGIDVAKYFQSEEEINKLLYEASRAANFASKYSQLVIYDCPIALPAGISGQFISADRHHVSYGRFLENAKYLDERSNLVESKKYPIISCDNVIDMIPGQNAEPLKNLFKSNQYSTYIFGKKEEIYFEVIIFQGNRL